IGLRGRPPTLRIIRPTPLDEVRTAMAFFDATLFTVIPRLYRALDAALDPPAGPADGPAAHPAGGAGGGPGSRHRPAGDPPAARQPVPATWVVDRWRPRRQPGRDRR